LDNIIKHKRILIKSLVRKLNDVFYNSFAIFTSHFLLLKVCNPTIISFFYNYTLPEYKSSNITKIVSDVKIKRYGTMPCQRHLCVIKSVIGLKKLSVQTSSNVWFSAIGNLIVSIIY